jgi:hypothetical protein
MPVTPHPDDRGPMTLAAFAFLATCALIACGLVAMAVVL